tara:strand:- start:1987 stop:2220 length:234 start_codon:yes stop_codon:yes gene_type:complete
MNKSASADLQGPPLQSFARKNRSLPWPTNEKMAICASPTFAGPNSDNTCPTFGIDRGVGAAGERACVTGLGTPNPTA